MGDDLGEVSSRLLYMPIDLAGTQQSGLASGRVQEDIGRSRRPSDPGTSTHEDGDEVYCLQCSKEASSWGSSPHPTTDWRKGWPPLGACSTQTERTPTEYTQAHYYHNCQHLSHSTQAFHTQTVSSCQARRGTQRKAAPFPLHTRAAWRAVVHSGPGVVSRGEGRGGAWGGPQPRDHHHTPIPALRPPSSTLLPSISVRHTHAIAA